MASTDSDPKAFIDDQIFEKNLLRKLDFRIVPILTLLYLLSFLDRVNIGNAKLANLEQDVGLVGNQYNLGLSIFFIGYIVFEIPSNLLLIKTSPSKWLPSMMLAWGIMMSLMAFVKNFSELMLSRFFLGVFESGLYPGVIYYITLWYKRSEQNLRIALFSVGSGIAGSFSGLLAYGIVRLDGTLNLSGWQWLFLTEGTVTVIFAIISYFLIYDSPEKANWLNDKERKFSAERIKNDAGKAHVVHFDKRQFWAAIKDWKIYLNMLLLSGLSVPFYSFSLFLPSIVNGMGFDYVISQLLSVPPFFCSAMSTIFVAILSDRKRIRGPFVSAFAFIGIIGYVLLMIPSIGIAGKYIGACIAGIGVFPSATTSVAWLTNNVAGNAKRGIASAMLISWANVGGIIASQIYQQKDAPHYLPGHLITIAFLFMGICVSTIQYIMLDNINKRKKVNPQIFLEGKSEEEVKDMGDEHPDFIYSL